jgi:diguanylate cyclase (GGDEF)-like protein
LRIIGTQSIDAVFLSLPENIPEKSSKLFLDFFSFLRQLCGVIPVFGLVKSEKHLIPSIELEDVFQLDIDGADLIRRANVFIKMKNLFDDSLLSGVHLDEYNTQKIVMIFHNNADFLHSSIIENSEIVMLRTWPVIDSISDSDLFIINMNHIQANKCCADLRLRRINRYKPIVFTFDEYSLEKLKQSVELNLEFTDAININDNPLVTKCRLNSFIKYKKRYEVFSKKLKNSLYLSAIDPLTEVYNRSFFNDYLKKKKHNFLNSAVVMLDIDKFKTINDQFGHSFADSMLKYVSDMIKRYIRASDIVARYGGDEFVIIMNNVEKSIAENIACRIQKKISDSFFGNTKCTVSIGVCCIGAGETTSMYEAVSIADKFMYVAKQNGGNSVKVCV